MKKIVSENRYEIKKIDGYVARLIDFTNEVISQLHKHDLKPSKELIEELLHRGCRNYFEDIAFNNLATDVKGLRVEAVKGLLELPNYSELQSSLQKLQSVVKYWSILDIKKDVAIINKKALESYKDRFRTFATSKEEIEVLELIEEFKDAFNKIDKKLQNKRDNGLMIHGNWNWRQWFIYSAFEENRFEINPMIYNHLLGR